MEKQPKIYSSFEEIELDLKILKLEREIHAQKIKMGFRETGENLRPMNLLQDYIGTGNQTTFSLIEQVIKFILQFVVKPFKE
ncbi:MAG: hypothetical protein K0S23_2413 [Fluviicola sp.]|jgi:hypothetical protein|uniref:DUF6327 family protein n=1 Tax=Fluviicola sp. TaxID=1917219 RepID=UPI0034599256|nr:hypothetical protein [Fluviicola sp.]